METSIVESIFRLIVLAGIVALVVITGWNEPLKYRFMSREEIAAQRTQASATPDWMWTKDRSKLERGAYNRTGSLGSGAR